jgi:uncharacterized iron-regulated protein
MNTARATPSSTRTGIHRGRHGPSRWAWLPACLGLAACGHLDRPEQTQRQLLEAMRSRPLVLLGEVHDNTAQHALRAQALRQLFETGARPALLMEQFDRERQADIDRLMAQPGATADELIAAAGAPGVGWAWPLYRPYVVLALDYHVPLIAANVSRTDARRVSQDGLAAAGFDSATPADVVAFQVRAILESHCGMLDETQAQRMALSQIARDQFMARVLAANAASGAVLLAGNGHVRGDVGVPRWLAPATRQRAVAIGVVEAADPKTDAFDRVITTAAQPRTDPCEGMKRPAP